VLPYPPAIAEPTVGLNRLPRQPEAFLMDPLRSSGMHLMCADDELTYLDFAGFHGSQPLGMNPPEFDADPLFQSRLLLAAMYKPSCSDVFTDDFAEFFARFDETFADPDLRRMFLIEGGSPAVENALKVAFDWKAQRAGADLRKPSWSVLHLTGSFHGRTGYALSLTNTRPTYTDRFPTFEWPRIPAPQVRFPIDVESVAEAEKRSLAAAEDAFTGSGGRIACVIAEPIQSEGGDNHLRGEYLRALQRLCHEHDALFVLDEVQTGAGATGRPWAYQLHGLEPDIVVFGKKLQVCGIMAGRRVHEVPGNVFETPARIGSTWGANLTDLVRATKIMEVIAERDLLTHVTAVGEHLLQRLREVQDLSGGYVENARGTGVLAAVDLPDTDARDGVLVRLRYEERILALPGGPRSIRFRPPLTVTGDEVDLLVAALTRACAAEEVEGG
jgi:L-lysine 6-transaminase